MLIREFAGAEAQLPRLMALAEFLRNRAKDQAVEPRISREAFIKLAASLGISITPQQLKDMVQSAPLNSIINDVTGGSDDEFGEIVFRGADEAPDQEMTPDHIGTCSCWLQTR